MRYHEASTKDIVDRIITIAKLRASVAIAQEKMETHKAYLSEARRLNLLRLISEALTRADELERQNS